MKNTLLLAAACLLFQNLFAQATEVKNLHYTFEQSSYNRKKELVIEKHEVNFFAGDSILVAERTKEDKMYPLYLFHFAKKAAVILMPNRKDYVVDELDSTFKSEQALEPTGKTKVINGYNCKEYEFTLNFTNTYVKLLPHGQQTSSTSKAFDYKFKAWITEDIAFNALYNAYLVALLRYDHENVVSNFNGVLVKLETTLTYGGKEWKFVNLLDKSKLSDNVIVPEMPWTVSKPGKALLPIILMEDPHTGLKYQDKRLLEKANKKHEFLTKVTGRNDLKVDKSLNLMSDCWW